MPSTLAALQAHRAALLVCRACPGVVPPVVAGPAVASRIYLLGQAPGPREGGIGRPFAWTAGRTLFRWFAEIGADEATFRERVYIGAVLRCFPGKGAGSGDRVPAPDEIARCSSWIRAEASILRPRLVIAVGKLAITQVAGRKVEKLDEIVGPLHRGVFHGEEVDWVALPHPSGLSAWPKVEPGRSLLRETLGVLRAHAEWRVTFPGAAGEGRG